MITQANSLPGVQTIGFQAGLNGTINLATSIGVSDSVDIEGPGSSTITVAGSNSLFSSTGGASLTIHGLTLSNPAGLSVPYPLTAAGDLIVTAGRKTSPSRTRSPSAVAP